MPSLLRHESRRGRPVPCGQRKLPEEVAALVVATMMREGGVTGMHTVGSRVGAHRGRPGWGWWLRRWLVISSAVFALAAFAGCDSGHKAGKYAAPAASTAAGPTPASTISPSPSPTRTGATGVCVTSTAKGSCGPYLYPAITRSNGQNTTVGQDVWNPIPGWSQTLHATDPGNWYVTADMPAGNTAVVSFPNVGQNIDWVNGAPPPLSSYTSIYSSFTENMNRTSGTSAEAAYDIWLNNWRNEVMIQHDIVNRGTCPVLATAEFGGSGGVPVQDWNLCKYGTELIWQLSGNGEQSSSVDILAMLTWLVSHGYLPQGSGLTAISYGFEICSTGGQPETFTLSRFSIRAG
jgi:hypothetical protein